MIQNKDKSKTVRFSVPVTVEDKQYLDKLAEVMGYTYKSSGKPCPNKIIQELANGNLKLKYGGYPTPNLNRPRVRTTISVHLPIDKLKHLEFLAIKFHCRDGLVYSPYVLIRMIASGELIVINNNPDTLDDVTNGSMSTKDEVKVEPTVDTTNSNNSNSNGNLIARSEVKGTYSNSENGNKNNGYYNGESNSNSREHYLSLIDFHTTSFNPDDIPSVNLISDTSITNSKSPINVNINVNLSLDSNSNWNLLHELIKELKN